MDGSVTAIVGLLGVILGGGVQAAVSWLERRRERTAVLQALAAEIEALLRLANHRGYKANIAHFRTLATQYVEAGKPEAMIPGMSLDMKHNVFVVYESLTTKIGMLHPYHADRIVRFHLYVRSLLENYREGGVLAEPTSADFAATAYTNDFQLFEVIERLALEIATFRDAAPPTGWTATSMITEDAGLPQPQPAAAP